MNYKEDLKEINKLIDQAKNIENLLRKSEIRIGKKSDFKITGYLGRNFLGDIIRSSKVSAINLDIGKLQREILDFHKNLMLYNEDLARKVDLPVKLEDFVSSKTVLSDIKLRTQMRLKELEVQKLLARMRTITKKLSKEKEKIYYNYKKEQELESFKKEKITF
ncbi:MAG: hypothetical protein PUG67_06475 [Peptoniphilaceae bacterium]|nr:hypothetical protein [Peptoniphilaceae bacterium]MDY6019652.1 hypothetical protein [Anaerococcus sp.]